WLTHRKHTVSAKTYRTDRDLEQLIDPTFGARSAASIKRTDIEAWLQRLRRAGHTYATVSRRRASISSFFQWLVDDHRIAANPVRDARQPRRTQEATDINPFSHTELDTLVATISQTSQHLADIVHVLGWTGLRWGEARALKVSDIRRDRNGQPETIRVTRSQSEGYEVKTTKSGRG